MDHLMTMGGMAENNIKDAIDALIGRSSKLCKSVFAMEKKIDAFEVLIDEECVVAIARRQPAANDLRFLIAASRMVKDLERIGDETEKIAKFALKYCNDLAPSRNYPNIFRLGRLVSSMLRKSLDAISRMDVQAALDVVREDRSVNEEYKNALNRLIKDLSTGCNEEGVDISCAWILRSLERIGDHAKNIAEQLIYMEQGLDLRHMAVSDKERAVLDSTHAH